MSGYSATPLERKLGWTEGMAITVLAAPEAYLAWLRALPQGLAVSTRMSSRVGHAHVFATERRWLKARLVALRPVFDDDGFLWVSWPKKAARVPTDITEDVIRELALPLGWVDVKVCAVDEVWSGLKLMIRKELRGKP